MFSAAARDGREADAPARAARVAQRTAGVALSPDGAVPALTSLRFVAALLVFLFHFAPKDGFWGVVAGEGHVGVGIFFVLSGFLITARYAERVARGGDLKAYIIRRVARILPLYYAVLVLSQMLSPSGVESPLGRLSEWTLTQALFGESIHLLVIPTSWSLTVEECFYFSAPLLFVLLAAVRRRFGGRELMASACVLLALAVALFGAGAAVWTLLAGRGPGFLRLPEHVTIHTFFGRFFDFAVGVFAALLLASPRGRRWGRTTGGALGSIGGTLVALALIVAAQHQMHAVGGIDGPRWAQAWAWNLVLAPGAALLILSLVPAANPIGRVLGAAPFAYLGKVSYALYLVQMTTIGKGILYRIVPRSDWSPAMLYVGLTILSALLYELVEEPARKLVLRAAGLGGAGASGRSLFRLRFAAAALLALVVAVQGSIWLTASTGHVTQGEAVAAAGGDHVLLVPGRDLGEPGGRPRSIKLPRRWREGWGDHTRAPTALWVFADGTPVSFSRRKPVHAESAAFFHGPRAERLTVRLTTVTQAVLIVRQGPVLAARVRAARLFRSPALLAAATSLFIAVLSLATIALGHGGVSLRTSVTVGLVALGLWCGLRIHEASWAPLVLATECAVVLVGAVLARPRRRERIVTPA